MAIHIDVIAEMNEQSAEDVSRALDACARGCRARDNSADTDCCVAIAVASARR